jgi:hypothetical protein
MIWNRLAWMGRPAEAIAAFERVLQLDPGVTQAQERLDRLQNSNIPNRGDTVA